MIGIDKVVGADMMSPGESRDVLAYGELCLSRIRPISSLGFARTFVVWRQFSLDLNFELLFNKTSFNDHS